MKNKDLESLSKKELIKLVLELQEEKRSIHATAEEEEYMREESIENDAYMERHGRINYGYGCGAYGPL